MRVRVLLAGALSVSRTVIGAAYADAATAIDINPAAKATNLIGKPLNSLPYRTAEGAAQTIRREL